MATDRQKAHSLITYYVQKYQDRYGSKPRLNRNKLQWGFANMVEDIGSPAAAKAIIDYYFECETEHDVEKFLYNYDDIEKMRNERIQDDERRAKLREETRKRMMQ